jgi:hypothetical protein
LVTGQGTETIFWAGAIPGPAAHSLQVALPPLIGAGISGSSLANANFSWLETPTILVSAFYNGGAFGEENGMSTSVPDVSPSSSFYQRDTAGHLVLFADDDGPAYIWDVQQEGLQRGPAAVPTTPITIPTAMADTRANLPQLVAHNTTQYTYFARLQNEINWFDIDFVSPGTPIEGVEAILADYAIADSVVMMDAVDVFGGVVLSVAYDDRVDMLWLTRGGSNEWEINGCIQIDTEGSPTEMQVAAFPDSGEMIAVAALINSSSLHIAATRIDPTNECL